MKITKTQHSSLSPALQGQKRLCSTTSGGFHTVFKANFFLFFCRDVKSNCKGFFPPRSR